MKRLFFISELYYPEETSTGYFITRIAEGIAAKTRQEHPVEVLSVQPTYSNRGVVAPAREMHKGIRIRRISAPRGDKNLLMSRAWNFVSLTVRFGWRMLWDIQRGDVVITVTNPPSLPVLAGLISRCKGAIPILIVHDLYPDVLSSVGILGSGGFLYRLLDRIQRMALGRMERIIVLGRDMRDRILEKVPERIGRIRIIPSWGSVSVNGARTRPENPLLVAHGLTDKFVIQFSGNLGRTHALEDLTALAEKFLPNPRVHFLVFGSGAGKTSLVRQIEEKRLSNITMLGPCPKEELPDYLDACDLFFLPYLPGMEGISVPSRMYNVMMAGKPILAGCSTSSELALVVEEERIGQVVEPGDIESMVEAIQHFLDCPGLLKEIGIRSREAALRKYTREKVIVDYVSMLEELEDENTTVNGESN